MEDFKIRQGLDVDTSIDSVIPAGAIIVYGGQTYSTTPAGTLGMVPCDGRAVSRTIYANLFSAIGTTWGSGDGSTTFNVPNFSDSLKFLAGANANTNLNTTAGSASHGHTVATEASGNTGNASMDHEHSYSGGTGYHDVYHTHNLGAFYMNYSGGPSPTVYKSDGTSTGAAINHAHSGYVPGLGWGGGTGGHNHGSITGNLHTPTDTSHAHAVTSTSTPANASSIVPSYTSAVFYIKF